jgi:hypothetical protein
MVTHCDSESRSPDVAMQLITLGLTHRGSYPEQTKVPHHQQRSTLGKVALLVYSGNLLGI